MSADNGVYIVKFLDGYRIAHAQAIESIFENQDCLVEYFSGHNVENADSIEAATTAAIKIHDDIGWTEYGITLIDDFQDVAFEAILMDYHGRNTSAEEQPDIDEWK